MITREEAVHIAKTALAIGESTLGKAWLVERLDVPSKAYYLVQFGNPDASIAVAAVDADTGEMSIHATLPGVEPHMTVEAEKAIEMAGGGRADMARLVWMPCRASKSPLYPFWEVKIQEVARYVDQQGNVLDRLDPAGPGG